MSTVVGLVLGVALPFDGTGLLEECALDGVQARVTVCRFQVFVFVGGLVVVRFFLGASCLEAHDCGICVLGVGRWACLCEHLQVSTGESVDRLGHTTVIFLWSLNLS